MSSADVFISWSGSTSKGVALALKVWLEDQYDQLTVFVSDVSIEAGQRGLDRIQQELAGAKIALVVVTQESLKSPWVNYEAGALGALPVESGRPRKVIPVLVDLKSPGELKGPLSAYQAVTLSKSDVEKLLRSINKAIGMAEEKAVSKLESGWPSLSERLHDVLASARITTPARARAERSTHDILMEILQLVRLQRYEAEPVQQHQVRSLDRNIVTEIVYSEVLDLSSDTSKSLNTSVHFDKDPESGADTVTIFHQGLMPAAAKKSIMRRIARRYPNMVVKFSRIETATKPHPLLPDADID